MPTIYHEPVTSWKAKRSGATMTIEGTNSDGSTAKLPNIVSIERREDGAWATDKDKNEHRLS